MKMESVSEKKAKLEELEALLESKLLAEKKLKWLQFDSDIRGGKTARKKCEELDKKITELEIMKSECEKVEKDKESELAKLTEEMSKQEEFLRDYEQKMIEPDIFNQLSKLGHIEQVNCQLSIFLY